MLDTRRGSDKLVLLVDQDRILTFRSLAVVQPPDAILRIIAEIVQREVISRSQLSRPTSPEGIQDEVTHVEIVMGLMSLQLPGFDSDIHPILIRPAAPHRRPLIRRVVEEVVQSHVIPERARNGGVVPEHTPGLGSIMLVTLEEHVFGMVVIIAVQEHRVGRSGEFVGTVVTICEKRTETGDEHVEQSGQPEVLVRCKETVVRSRSRQQRRRHLRVASGTEIPVVGCLCPCSVGGDGLRAVLNGVGDSQAEYLGGEGGAGIVLVENGEGSECETAVANAIPVALGIVRPPAVELPIAVGVGSETLAETIGDHVLPDLRLLIIGPCVVHPIVGNAERSSELCGIEKVRGIPLVTSTRTEGR